YLKFSKTYSPKYPILLYSFIMAIRPNYFAVRAGFAICICFWAYQFIKKQDLKKFLLVVALGCSIHYQCLILLPFYFAGKIKMPAWLYIIVFFSFAILANLYQSYFIDLVSLTSGDLKDKIDFYSSYIGKSHRVIQITGILSNLFFILNFLYVRKMKHLEKNEWYNALLNMNLIYNACIIIFSEGMGELVRLANVFFPAYAILMIHTITCYFHSKQHLWRIGAASFFAIYYLYKFPQQFAGYYFEITCLPYRTIFDFFTLK
ncbi:MAG: EpsG family protein, partial [Clostridia bacterium]|nr:EpsG family protein [Clostridia bacterium]